MKARRQIFTILSVGGRVNVGGSHRKLQCSSHLTRTRDSRRGIWWATQAHGQKHHTLARAEHKVSLQVKLLHHRIFIR